MKITGKQIGFTLIELLIVIAIIGMLLSIVMVNVGNSRIRSRDSKRLADIHQIKSGLDLYFLSASGYPDSTDWNSGVLICGDQHILDVPKDPLLNLVYEYETEGNLTNTCNGGGTTEVWREYQVEFTTEDNTDYGPAGTYYLTLNGVSTTALF